MILLNSMKEFYPKTKQQAADCKRFLDLLVEKYPADGFKSLAVRLDVYVKMIVNLKSLPEAPAKSGDREKKPLIGSSSVNP